MNISNIQKYVTDIFKWLVYQLKMLKHRPRLWWNKLFIRSNEFHSSLDMDAYALVDMNENDRKKYIADLIRRRNIAHERDMGV